MCESRQIWSREDEESYGETELRNLRPADEETQVRIYMSQADCKQKEKRTFPEFRYKIANDEEAFILHMY